MQFKRKTYYINLILTDLWKSYFTITFPAIGYFHSGDLVLFTHRFIPTENQPETRGETTLFGTDRTFTFIGILGYLLYILDPKGNAFIYGRRNNFRYVTGHQLLCQAIPVPRVWSDNNHHRPYHLLYGSYHKYTTFLVLRDDGSHRASFTEMKHTFTELVQRMQNDEMITLAKFLAISGYHFAHATQGTSHTGYQSPPYTIWLATVVVSGISYLSYLLKQYVFRESGTLVSGIIGGLYSSTATISILARKCKRIQAHEIPEYVSAMMLAVSMMFLRFMILILIFQHFHLSEYLPLSAHHVCNRRRHRHIHP